MLDELEKRGIGRRHMNDDQPVILVVDDEAEVRRAMLRELRDMGVVIEADSGEKALEVVEHVTFDLVISDLSMPGMGGLSLFWELVRKDPDTRRVLMSTGEPDSLDSLVDDGVVHGFLRKPWDRSELRSLVETLVGKAPRRSGTGRERRRADRVELSMRAFYGSVPAGNFHAGALRDVSRNGARIRGEFAVEAGQLIEVVLEASDGPRISGVAQVVWTGVAGEEAEFGVHFVEFSDSVAQTQLQKWVDSRKTE